MKLIATIESEPVVEHQSGCVTFVSKAAIDADGSGGNPHQDPDFQPHTSLRNNGSSLNAYTERFIVVPPAIIRGVKGVVLGCQAYVSYRGKCVSAVVGDVGPAAKLGEISVACARALGIPWNPRNGGVSEHVVHYQLWPGVAAAVDGVQYGLQASR